LVGKETILFFTAYKRALWSSYIMDTASSFLRRKGLALSSGSAMVQDVWSNTSTLPHIFME
jgi:hypothetical protein